MKTTDDDARHVRPAARLLAGLLLLALPGSAACADGGAAPRARAEEASATRQEAEVAFDHSHALWTKVLEQHVHGDRFDYAALKEDRATFDRYLAQLERVTAAQLASWSREQRFAFWIDVYNAYTVKLIVENYPLETIKGLGGLFTSVWDERFIPLEALDPKGEGRKLSLNDVEHEILRKRFEDARVHAAINCASKSCPPLRAEAFVAKELDAQLDEQVKAWLADPQRNRFDREKETVELSKIFEWFQDDFVRDGGSVLGWVAKYVPEERAAWLRAKGVRVRHLDYDWKLNDWRPKEREGR